MAQSAYVRKTSIAGGIVAALVLAGSGWASWSYLHWIDGRPLSPNAVIRAEVVEIAATAPGRIATIAVAENQWIRKGDPLFTIDPEPYRLAVAQAQADLDLAQATLEAQKQTVAAERSNAGIAASQTDRARTNLALAEATLARLTPLAPKGYVSPEELDSAAAARQDAATSLSQADLGRVAAEALVSNLEASEALVDARRAALAEAERQLAATTVYAPHDGAVAGLAVGAGQFVTYGQPVFTLIDTKSWFASAIYPETNLDNIGIGDCVSVYLLADRTAPLEGKVQGIGWGVHATGAANPVRSITWVPKTLNWARLVQGFPVRIELADPPRDLMRMGASAITVVHHDRSC